MICKKVEIQILSMNFFRQLYECIDFLNDWSSDWITFAACTAATEIGNENQNDFARDDLKIAIAHKFLIGFFQCSYQKFKPNNIVWIYFFFKILSECVCVCFTYTSYLRYVLKRFLFLDYTKIRETMAVAVWNVLC